MSAASPRAKSLASAVQMTAHELVVGLKDGRTIFVPLARFPRLLRGTSDQRRNWEFLGGGEGIHWSDLDEDISVKGLLRDSSLRSSHGGNSAPAGSPPPSLAGSPSDAVVLWTWQSPEFRLTEGHVDHTKSAFCKELPQRESVFGELWRRLWTDQIVWCLTRKDSWDHSGVQAQLEWVLEVPRKEILRIVDAFVWNKLVLQLGVYPPSLLNKWDMDAKRLASGNTAIYDDSMATRKAEYDAPVPREELWDRLFIKDLCSEGANALIRHPVDPSWVRMKILYPKRAGL